MKSHTTYAQVSLKILHPVTYNNVQEDTSHRINFKAYIYE